MNFAINNNNGEHLGFILFAGDEQNGECIFRSLPKNPKLFETEEVEVINQLQDLGEFSYQLISSKYEITHSNLTSPIVVDNLCFQLNGFNFKVTELNT